MRKKSVVLRFRHTSQLSADKVAIISSRDDTASPWRYIRLPISSLSLCKNLIEFSLFLGSSLTWIYWSSHSPYSNGCNHGPVCPRCPGTRPVPSRRDTERKFETIPINQKLLSSGIVWNNVPINTDRAPTTVLFFQTAEFKGHLTARVSHFRAGAGILPETEPNGPRVRSLDTAVVRARWLPLRLSIERIGNGWAMDIAYCDSCKCHIINIIWCHANLGPGTQV